MAFPFTDTASYTDLSDMKVLINAPFTYAGSCAVMFTQADNKLYLINDAGTAWTGALTIAQAGTISNSQCTLDAGASSFNGVGTTSAFLHLAFTFQSSFTGQKSVWQQADDYDGQQSAWTKTGSWTPSSAGPPSAVSVTPSSGTGLTQTFTYQFSDPNGISNISNVQALFNGSFTYAGGCGVMYTPSNGFLYLINDAGSAWLGPVTAGQAGTLNNSQCTLDAAGSSSSGSGSTLNVSFALTFAAGFSSAKSDWAIVADAGGTDSGWTKVGTWNQTTSSPASPSVGSAYPTVGVGTTPFLTYTFSDPNGFADISNIQILINDSFTYAHSCSVMYTPGNNLFYLINDDGATWKTPTTIAANSQCTLYTNASTATRSGNTVTLRLRFDFNSGSGSNIAFSGMKTQWADAVDSTGLEAGWTRLGTWNVAADQPPSDVSITPSYGVGTSQTFTYVVSDPDGTQTIDTINVQFINELGYQDAQSCELVYSAIDGKLHLYTDAGQLGTGATPGSAVVLSNSQCSVDVSNTQLTAQSSTTLALTVPFTFQPGYNTQQQKLRVFDNNGLAPGISPMTADWYTTVLPPTFMGTSPSSGGGSSVPFTYNYKDGGGYTYIGSIQVLINSGLSYTNSCGVLFQRASGTLYLINDAGTAWQGPITIAQAGTLSNSQCAIDASQSSYSGSGTALTLILKFIFNAVGFGGAKTQYTLPALDNGQNNGWKQAGTWTVQ